ncbi:MAG TPA: aromatic amino acid transport family protein [Candidatus Paceibacterota bacterium]|mgnify:FL=1|nr:aromatic amino acid transport family protein [Candidatus Paceibacterota bacterium]
MNKIALAEAIAALVGTIIGAGVFTLPYVANLSGVVVSIFWLVLVSLIILFLHLAFGEIVLRTPNDYRLPGYTGHYLGTPAKKFILITTFLTFSISLLIYLILGTQFFELILKNFKIVNLEPNLILLFLWLIFNLSILDKSNTLAAKINFYLSFILIFLFLLIAFFALPHLDFAKINLFNSTNKFGWLIPYGVFFYALNGAVAVPETIAILKKHNLKEKTKQIIKIGSLIPVFIYFIFIIAVLGVAGSNVSKETIISLIPVLGKSVAFIGALVGFLAVATSYLIFATYIKNSFMNDFGWTPFISYLVVILGPMVFYLLGLQNVIKLTSFIGGMVGGLEGVMIILILKKAKEKKELTPPYEIPLNKVITGILITALIIGAICQTFLVY